MDVARSSELLSGPRDVGLARGMWVKGAATNREHRMQNYIGVFVVALVAGLLLTPVVRRLGLALGAVASAGGRNVNVQAVPRLGGVALAVGWCVAVLVFLGFGENAGAVAGLTKVQLWTVLVGGVVLCLVGAVDDVRGVRAAHKLAAQLIVATATYAFGFRIDTVVLPLFGSLPMGVFALPVTVLWIVGITNALNLIDGLDGLAAGVSFFAALTSFVVSIISGNVYIAMMMAALMGVLGGFLFFNFNPARVFMGDSGSYFLGYVLATLSLSGALQQKASTAVSLLVPMIALGLPIFDTLLTIVRRFLEKRSIFAADRGHIHHRLLDLGLTHRRAVMLLYGVSVVFTASAIAISLGRTWQTGVALLSVSVVLVALVRFVGYFEYVHVLRRQKARMYDPRTERLRHVVPRLLRELHEAQDEAEVLSALTAVARECSFEGLEIEDQTGGSRRAESIPPLTAKRDLLVRATYPLGRDDRARARVRFAWRGDEPDVLPQAAILLQVLIDATVSALERCGSSLAPMPEPVSEPSYEPSGLVVPSSSRI